MIADRHLGIGGSDAAVICGLSPYKTPYQLYLEKRGELAPSDEDSEAMYWGTVLEEPVAQKYIAVTGRQIRRQPPKVSSQYPWMRGSIDRQIIGQPQGPGILEVKTVNAWSGKCIQHVDDIPDHWYLQLQHYLALYGYRWGSAAVLVGGQRFLHFDIEANPDVIAELLAREAEFWERVQTGRPPAVDGSERTAEAIKARFYQDRGTTITLEHPDLLSAAQQLSDDKVVLKSLEAKMTHAESMLKAAMGDAAVAVLPGWGEITWRTAKPRNVEVVELDLLRRHEPEVYAKYVHTDSKPSGRRFLLKPANGGRT